MDRRKKLLFFTAVVLWGLVVAAGIIYLFFPYQRVIKIALQNMIGGGKAAVAMEGVNTKLFGIQAKKLFLIPDATGSQTIPFELSDVDISWSPFSVLKGSLSFYSRASLYNGLLHATVSGISFPGSSSPSVFLDLKGIDMAKCPEGVFPWFRGVTGTLNGVIRKDVPLTTPDKQSGTFQFTLKSGEVKDLQIKDLPRLVIPYQQIAVEGKMNGPRIEVKKIILTSDVVLLRGSGLIDSTDLAQNLDINLSYEALSKTLPLKGKGTISIRGSQAAPLVTISGAVAAKTSADGKS